jgi:hypothetical protein
MKSALEFVGKHAGYTFAGIALIVYSILVAILLVGLVCLIVALGQWIINGDWEWLAGALAVAVACYILNRLGKVAVRIASV